MPAFPNSIVLVEWDFFNKETVSVRLDTRHQSDFRELVELTMLCSVATRQMLNLQHGSTLLMNQDTTVVPLSTPQKKRFKASLEISPARHLFQMAPEGFGIFGFDIGHHAERTVASLKQVLRQRHVQSPKFQSALPSVLPYCTDMYHRGELTMANQQMMSLVLAASLLGQKAEFEAAMDAM